MRRIIMKKTVSIGAQDFAALREQDCFYIDKTAFIGDWCKDRDIVTLITRPRHFGKTLNMSMLECFFPTDMQDGERNFSGSLRSGRMRVFGLSRDSGR